MPAVEAIPKWSMLCKYICSNVVKHVKDSLLIQEVSLSVVDLNLLCSPSLSLPHDRGLVERARGPPTKWVRAPCGTFGHLDGMR